MALKGTLKDFGLADIFQLIGIQRKTGVLTLTGGSDTVTVSFHEGEVVGADTRHRNIEDLLGAVLVRTGRITETQLQEALQTQQRTLQRLGYVLVRQGLISEEDLREALRIQVTQIVYRLFRWREGSYHFNPADHLEFDRDHFQPINAETILMEGARMVDEWPIIERRIRSADVVFRRTAAGAALEAPVRSIVEADIDLGFGAAGEAFGDSEGVRLSVEEREILRMVDGKATVQDLVDRSSLGEFDTYRILYELLTRNLVEEVRQQVVADVLGGLERRRNILGFLGKAAALLLAAAMMSTVADNPLTPWRLMATGEETDRLRAYASRGRLERIERALQVFYLDVGAVPEALPTLARHGYLRPPDLLDPWGREYGYQLLAGGYRLEGLDSVGRPSEDLTVNRRFGTVQRMLIEGRADPEDSPPNRP
jgi:hypothetical protein